MKNLFEIIKSSTHYCPKLFIQLGSFVGVFLLSETNTLASEMNVGVSVNTIWLDSTANQRAAEDLATLEKHIKLTKAHQESIYNMFLGKYQYLERHEASGTRWEWTVKINKQKLREWLGDEAYTLLDDAGLIKQWFGVTQQ
jgi:hypothetical protein